jgi:hypothetical protein
MNRRIVSVHEIQCGGANDHAANDLSEHRRLPHPLGEFPKELRRDEDRNQRKQKFSSRHLSTILMLRPVEWAHD